MTPRTCSAPVVVAASVATVLSFALMGAALLAELINQVSGGKS